MAAFLKKLQSLAAETSSVATCTISLSSRQFPSEQTTKLDQENNAPIIVPLDTLDQALSWQPGCDELCVATVPLHCQGAEVNVGTMADPTAQKMLICHDMMGGYVKDKFTQGVREMEDYYFYHWQHIGAFIYFSHHFVTLPPPSWTNAAHRHGVLSMGTIITEWENGAGICHSFLQDELKMTQLAQQLVTMSQYYGFDGWLINIENPIHPILLDQLHMFLSLITTGMHDICPGSKVIWYDSVTTEGKLKWQNMLNHMNRPYFDLCDGIFLNYNWTESGLSSSRALAKERKGEVYVGIDVFGRGCPGGGGYNSCQALEAIHRHGLSSALFAPGWVFETQDKQQFFRNENKFWSLLRPWLQVTPISSLPLVSSFGRGCGNLLAIDGQVVYTDVWTNHSAQDLQPSFCTESSIQNDSQSGIMLESVGLDLTSAYNNGASIKVEGKIKDTALAMSKPSILRLFKTHLSLSKPVMVAYTYKIPGQNDLVPTLQGYRYFIQLHTSGSPSRIFLDPFSSVSEDKEAVLTKSGLPRSCDVPDLPGCVLSPLSSNHSHVLHQIFTGASEQGETWKTCYFVIDHEVLRSSHIREITIGFYMSGSKPSQMNRRFSLNIGQIKVIDADSLSLNSELSIISDPWCHDFHFSDDYQKVSFTLLWQTVSNPSDPIDHCNIYLSSIISESDLPTEDEMFSSSWKSEYIFLGKSYTRCFFISNLFLLFGSDAVGSHAFFEFRVQPVCASHRKPAIKDSRCIVVNFKP